MYMPSSAQLHQVREHIAANHRHLQAIVASPAFKRVFGQLEGEKLKRVPLGFPKEHPAAEWLKFRQFLAGCERPAEFATRPGFYRSVAAAFRTLAPLIAFLNAPLLAGRERTGDPSRWLSSDW